jgi:hypothetical protein
MYERPGRVADFCAAQHGTRAGYEAYDGSCSSPDDAPAHLGADRGSGQRRF